MIILHFNIMVYYLKFSVSIESMAKLFGDWKCLSHLYCKTYIGLQRGGHPRFYLIKHDYQSIKIYKQMICNIGAVCLWWTHTHTAHKSTTVTMLNIGYSQIKIFKCPVFHFYLSDWAVMNRVDVTDY